MTIVGVGVRMTPFKGWVEAGGEEIHLSNIMFMFFFFFFFSFQNEKHTCISIKFSSRPSI